MRLYPQKILTIIVVKFPVQINFQPNYFCLHANKEYWVAINHTFSFAVQIVAYIYVLIAALRLHNTHQSPLKYKN